MSTVIAVILVVGLVIGGILVARMREPETTRPATPAPPRGDERIGRLLDAFAERPNSLEVLAEKGKQYGMVIWEWASEDALAFAAEWRSMGNELPAGVNAEAVSLAASLEVGATYVVRAMVLAQDWFPDSRIPPWADALASTVAFMAVVIDGDGNRTLPMEQLLDRYFEPQYAAPAIHNRFLDSGGARLCEILHTTRHIALDHYFQIRMAARFCDFHVPLLLAGPSEMPRLVATIRERLRRFKNGADQTPAAQ